MSRHLTLYITSLFLLMAFAACGSSSKFNPNNVSVSVSPATANVATSGQLPLQASVQGLGSGIPSSVTLWTITENPTTSDCAVYVGIVISDPCPAGTIQIANSTELTVTYFAPTTAGTYHVVAEWEDFVNFTGPPLATKTGTTVVTVGP